LQEQRGVAYARRTLGGNPRNQTFSSVERTA
jgi:hypothetical protein